jgi:hypothetical protein
LALDRHASEKSRGVKTSTGTAIPVEQSSTLPGNSNHARAVPVEETTTGNVQKRPIPIDLDCGVILHTSSVATTGAPAKPAGTPQSKLQNAGGPISAGDIDRLRDELRAFLKADGYGAQKRIGSASGVAEATLSRFKGGKSLPETAFVPLRLALAKLTGERKAA